MNRRNFNQGALGLALGAFAARQVNAQDAVARTPEKSQSKAKTFVLVHGAWYGGWCWKKVAKELRAAGHYVSTPTCPGVGEAKHLLSKDITLTTHITSIVNHIQYEGLSDVVLVGSGFSGLVISGVADRIPHTLRTLVYLDALVVPNGVSAFDAQPAEITRKRLEQVAREGNGIAIPPPPLSTYDIVAEEDKAWVGSLLTPHPVGPYQEKFHLKNPIGNGVPRIYVDCVAHSFAPLAKLKKDIRAQPGWIWRELDARHDPMVTEPHLLNEFLQSI
ncbi:alpha/beta fold hydrolase [Burkholderia stagnalis]|uniref:Alpha/beta fold hydrolase n=1 Tax=Burkholderia stagnalis TaxID=1503054 RepID=A0ABX9YRX4_9BURK|nr:alpha/beta fold hydrolase [Burkholderia stagnalis]RQQ61924.1 alpha/beta fold hydrolase [Burkholderia stagnalis]RQQ71840.1 alpha/beta fold hydrolase [Burkholderia stagnalis]RQQ73033.1 alpha/beta fold hydrolase [Burkholderia stagnalis]RQQ84628.1 alpha/beta fold hydrolase [Burkholderia stagnalis]RQQ92370.1 alpha/beta fold hydrolase [Burkholderia stagnalis]